MSVSNQIRIQSFKIMLTSPKLTFIYMEKANLYSLCAAAVANTVLYRTVIFI